MQRFTDLKVWQRAHALVLDVYRSTSNFPSEERFGIVSQIRRAVASVPTNIAEGSKRDSNPEYARFLNIAQASLAETEYLLILSRDLGYLHLEVAEKMMQELNEVGGMLTNLRNRVSATPNSELPTPNRHD
jgi:four helix bundle protein